MRFTLYGRTDGSILVSYIKFDVYSSLALIHERQENMADLERRFQKYVQ